MTHSKYIGSELDLFAKVRNWKWYWAQWVRPFLALDISENRSRPSAARLHEPAISSSPSRLSWRRLPVLLWVVVFCLSIDVVALSVRMFADFRNYRDVGYPDSGTILRIAGYVQTGTLYPDINQPPYHPTLYGPLGYVIFSVPYRLAIHYSYPPERALRLAVFGLFLGSVALVFLITRRLTGSIKTALLGVLFAVSGAGLHTWLMQIRFDMLGLSLALLGVWLCLGSERRRNVVLAAVCGGLAVLCKQSFVAMPAAAFLWFLYLRRFMTALWWVIGVATIVITGYGFVVLREPLAWQHLEALSSPVFGYSIGLSMVLSAMSEAKVLFFFVGAYFAWRQRVEGAPLIMFYGLAALFIAVLTILQVGGNTNYFIEFWMISAILAAPGLAELNRQLRRTPVAVTALLMLLLFHFFALKFRNDLKEAGAAYQETREYAQGRLQWERFRAVLAGRRLLTFSPDITLWSRLPEVPDPFWNSVLEQKGRWSSAPILRNVEAGVYEAIIEEEVEEYRGVEILPSVHESIKQHYLRACQLGGCTVWLPPHGAPDLYDRLTQAGCVPISKAQ